MPRSARVVIVNHPHHVVQRGHNCQVVFAHDDDFSFYLATLQEWKERLKCKVYAYCLMTNHIHMVIEPSDKAEDLGRLMKRVAGRYTRYINKKELRTGTVWEGRYKSSLIDASDYMLACCRYVEMNPVRAGIVEPPEGYRWSSYAAKVGTRKKRWIDLDGFYLGLGTNKAKRQQRYCQWMHETTSETEIELIQTAVSRNQLTGCSRFVDEIEKKLGRRVELRGRGRPKKSKK